MVENDQLLTYCSGFPNLPCIVVEKCRQFSTTNMPTKAYQLRFWSQTPQVMFLLLSSSIDNWQSKTMHSHHIARVCCVLVLGLRKRMAAMVRRGKSDAKQTNRFIFDCSYSGTTYDYRDTYSHEAACNKEQFSNKFKYFPFYLDRSTMASFGDLLKGKRKSTRSIGALQPEGEWATTYGIHFIIRIDHIWRAAYIRRQLP